MDYKDKIVKGFYNSIDKDIKIELVTDEERLRQWNYKEPCVMLFNQVSSGLIPCSKLSFDRLQTEIKWISKRTEDILKAYNKSMHENTSKEVEAAPTK